MAERCPMIALVGRETSRGGAGVSMRLPITVSLGRGSARHRSPAATKITFGRMSDGWNLCLLVVPSTFRSRADSSTTYQYRTRTAHSLVLLRTAVVEQKDWFDTALLPDTFPAHFQVLSFLIV